MPIYLDAAVLRLGDLFLTTLITSVKLSIALPSFKKKTDYTYSSFTGKKNLIYC